MMISRRSIPKVMAATTLVLGGCGGDGGSDVVVLDIDVTETIDETGGTIADSGVRVVIPAGEFSDDTEVRVQTVDASDLPLPIPNGLTAASSIIRVSATPSEDYFDVEVSIPYAGEGATIIQLQYDTYDEEWEWEVADDDYGGATLSDGVATGTFPTGGYFLVVRPVTLPGVDVPALCEGFATCDEEEDYTQAQCEARLAVAVTVYADYYAALGAACGDAIVDYYACLSDSWKADPVCSMEYGYSEFPEFEACEEALIEACPEID
uniref:Lipoprotein n=1 Tax=uncultured bacterium A1Q1_fos_479 TaxID=1256575 RepID=L7VXP9_9BACT|nr:hypothetical protein [uncultured bacterium A1Q1_fos_479]